MRYEVVVRASVGVNRPSLLKTLFSRHGDKGDKNIFIVPAWDKENKYSCLGEGVPVLTGTPVPTVQSHLGHLLPQALWDDSGLVPLKSVKKHTLLVHDTQYSCSELNTARSAAQWRQRRMAQKRSFVIVTNSKAGEPIANQGKPFNCHQSAGLGQYDNLRVIKEPCMDLFTLTGCKQRGKSSVLRTEG
jgi:hypothetical protein